MTSWASGLTPDELAASTYSLTWSDGTVMPPAPTSQVMSAADRKLADEQSAVDRRTHDVAAEDQRIAAERTRIEAVDADLTALEAQLDPGRSGSLGSGSAGTTG